MSPNPETRSRPESRGPQGALGGLKTERSAYYIIIKKTTL